MKENTHPEYRDVVFEDMSTNERFIMGSSVKTKETVEIDGKKYPLYKIEVSWTSHSFYTKSKSKIMDTAGRVEKFNQRFGKYQRNTTT